MDERGVIAAGVGLNIAFWGVADGGIGLVDVQADSFRHVRNAQLSQKVEQLGSKVTSKSSPVVRDIQHPFARRGCRERSCF
jgi:hypothetical protein